MEPQFRKVYVNVLVQHLQTGEKVPLSLQFEDGHSYPIDRVLDARRASASKVGGTGIRYTIRIRGKETYLFEDENFWYVEAKS